MTVKKRNEMEHKWDYLKLKIYNIDFEKNYFEV